MANKANGKLNEKLADASDRGSDSEVVDWQA